MKVFVKGKGEISLSQSNFVAQGGQASVYQKNGTAYKIYTEVKDAIPEAKFKHLSAIHDGNVVRPEDLLIDPKTATPLGYTMRFVNDTYTLCQVIPKPFRDRNNVGQDKIQKLVAELQNHIENVHRAGVLIVDLNEMNILVNQALDEVFMIDVDSYQTPGFKAEVIMPSVRDWSVRSTQFSELSDWFSFAVLTCQLFLGIHPYKGRHKTESNDLEHRMRGNLSIFDPAVNIPKVCSSVDVIPAQQREWLKAVLQNGKRLAPPPPGGAPAPVVPVTRPALVFGGQLIVMELYGFEHPVLNLCESGNDLLVRTTVGIEFNRREVHHGDIPGTVLLGFSPKMGHPIALSLHGGVLRLHELSRKRVTELPIAATEIAKSGPRFYIRNRNQVLEVDFAEMPDRMVATASHPVANVLESASRLFDGVAVQSMGGSVFVSLFPRTRAGYQVRIPELDRYHVVDAKFEGGVLMVVGAQGGMYDRLVFRFDEWLQSYETIVVPNVPLTGLNFIVLASGVTLSLTEDEKLSAFPAAKEAKGGRLTEDPAIGGDMRLVHLGGRAGFIRENKIYSVGLK